MHAIPPDTLDYWHRQGIDVAREADRVVAAAHSAAAAWQITITGPPLTGGLTSVVYPGVRDGREVVLKSSPMFAVFSRDEGQALSLWAGQGAARRLGGSLDGRVQVIEHLQDAGVITDDEAADVLRVIHARRTETSTLPPLALRIDSLFAWARHLAPADHAVINAAHSRARQLADDPVRPVIVHGDLQSKNLRRRAGELVVIDPIPAVGDGACDVALWAVCAPPYERAVSRAADMAEHLGYDPRRAERWVEALSAVVASWPQHPTRQAECATRARSAFA